MTKVEELLQQIDADIAAMDRQIEELEANRARLHYRRNGMLDAIQAIRADEPRAHPLHDAPFGQGVAVTGPFKPGTPDADPALQARRTRRLRQVVLAAIDPRGSTVKELAEALALRPLLRAIAPTAPLLRHGGHLDNFGVGFWQIESALDRLGAQVTSGVTVKGEPGWFRTSAGHVQRSGSPTPREPAFVVAATTKTDTDALDFIRGRGWEGASEEECTSLTPPISVDQLDRLVDAGKLIWSRETRRYLVDPGEHKPEAVAAQ